MQKKYQNYPKFNGDGVKIKFIDINKSLREIKLIKMVII